MKRNQIVQRIQTPRGSEKERSKGKKGKQRNTGGISCHSENFIVINEKHHTSLGLKDRRSFNA